GKETALHFSNRPRSLESSIGFYVTADPYIGSNGYSLRLNGLEYGFNSNASRREIVVHGANYVSEDYINSNGYLGRSWGCPAVPMENSKDIIESIKNGTCLFIYSPIARYLSGSKILNSRS
ncbi:MAG TPA: murein L,D-transpeptidase catalytic domain family protein, partial [Puia sp.]|nr:murein L,D-transpeptidase catalytic domain family protein [Puia sp.]